MSNFGIPYMGSKSKICKEICGLFPKAENFYDLFGGGFSISDFMIRYRSKDYKQFHFNEIRPGICDLIKDAIAGKYNYKVFKPKWISREEFFERKEIDAYVKVIWSFGNNGNDYIFGKDIERYKKSMHNAIVFNEFDEQAENVLGIKKFNDGLSIYDKRLFLRNRVIILNKHLTDSESKQLERLEQLERIQQLEQLQQLQQLERLQQLQQLQQLQRLERLERIQQLERLCFYNTSYEKVEIKDNSIIYCDIPYDGTVGYGEFDRKRFLDWASEQVNPVFISEYQINDSRFKEIYRIKKRSLLDSGVGRKHKMERVYVNKAGFKSILSR
jgi:site-specific DNA-adenine methylase